MLTRIIVAIALLPLLVFVIYLAPLWGLAWILPAVVALASAWMALELLLATGLAKKKRIAVYAAVAAAAVPFYFFWDVSGPYGIAELFTLTLLLCAEAVLDHERVTFTQVSGALFAAVVVPLFLSSLVRIAKADSGQTLILLPFLAAFGSDIFALFGGMLFGKHKLAPEISPKKTVEGAISGLVGALLLTALYNIALQLFFTLSLPWLPLLLTALVGAAVSQLGDLSFSLIKRENGIKDFGRILPGHGGILDRFDGLLFAAPAVELCLLALLGVRV